MKKAKKLTLKQKVLKNAYKLDEKICKVATKTKILELVADFITEIEKLDEN